jgi:hypothetical protein
VGTRGGRTVVGLGVAVDGGVAGRKQGQVVAGNASLPRAGAGRGKALDQFGHIEPFFDGLLDIFDGGVLIETDKALAPPYRCRHQLATSLGSR